MLGGDRSQGQPHRLARAAARRPRRDDEIAVVVTPDLRILSHGESSRQQSGATMPERKEITGRDAYIMVEALTFTIEALSGLPIELRPDSNMD